MNLDLVYLFWVLMIGALALIAIYKITQYKSALGVDEKDFVTSFIEGKKKKINSNIGGITFKTYVLLIVALPVVGGILAYLLSSNMIITILVAAVLLCLPDLILKFTAQKQEKLFEERYARGLKALVSGLRSNLTIGQAVEDVANNPFIEANIREGFQQISSDIKVGLPIEEAFERFAEHSKSPDARDVAAAVAMQAKVGGSEAKIIETIAASIHNRIMLRKEINASFSETSVTVLVMDFAPIAGFLLMYFMLPDFIGIYFESVGYFLILMAIFAFSFVGSIYIHRKMDKAKKGE